MNHKNIIKIEDRKLGDEWKEWKGKLGKNEKNASSGKRLFVLVLLITLFFLGLTGFFFWYLITPRLNQFHPHLSIWVGLVFTAAWLLMAIWFCVMVLSLLLEKDILLFWGRKRVTLTFLVPFVMKIGLRFGFSWDRMSNSIVKIYNQLTKSSIKNTAPENILILLPRCLQKNLIQRITQTAKNFNIHVATVAGGSKALEIISELRPHAIIGVACERDLLSGIQEVIGRIPVIGIPNIRPEGPCKNTLIDEKELESALYTLTGLEIHLIK